MQSTTIGNALFTKTQQKIMGLLFQKPDTSFYLNEIVRLAGMGKGTVMRELEKMTDSGLLTVKPIGNQKHYQANASSPIFDELLAITRKTFGLADVVSEVLMPAQNTILYAFIYGSVAKGTETASSDIDLMIIGKGLVYADVMGLLLLAEQELQRTINPTLYTPQDFRKKMDAKNSFLTRIMEQDRIAVMGDENAIG